MALFVNIFVAYPNSHYYNSISRFM